MLGRKKGLRDISRGMEDISKGMSDMKIARAKTPEDALRLMEEQRDRHLGQAASHQAKAKGIFNGPAELRAAKASEAKANQYQRRIDKLLQKHPQLAPAPAATLVTSERIVELRKLYDQGLISEDEYERKRVQLLEDL